MSNYTLEIFPSRTKGQYRVRFKAPNKKTLWVAEGYFSKSNAKRFARKMQGMTLVSRVYSGTLGRDRYPEIVEVSK